jgi:PleD family two-component response regulator
MEGQSAESDRIGAGSGTGPGRRPEVVALVLGSEAVAEAIRQRLEGAAGVAVIGCADMAGLMAIAGQGQATVVVIPASPSSPDPRAVLQQLQAEAATAELPAIVVGGSGHPGERRRAFAAGAADHWLELPERTELLVRLQVLSRGMQARRARDAAQAEVESLRRQLAHASLGTGGALDPETALPGPARLEELLDAEWRRARRSGGSLSVVLVELGQPGNDSGPPATEPGQTESPNDRLRLASALRATLRRGGDLLARWQDRRFAALLPEVGSDGAETVARALVHAARNACPGHRLHIGRATARPSESPGGTALSLLRDAAAALSDPAALD